MVRADVTAAVRGWRRSLRCDPSGDIPSLLNSWLCRPARPSSEGGRISDRAACNGISLATTLTFSDSPTEPADSRPQTAIALDCVFVSTNLPRIDLIHLAIWSWSEDGHENVSAAFQPMLPSVQRVDGCKGSCRWQICLRHTSRVRATALSTIASVAGTCSAPAFGASTKPNGVSG